MKNNLFADSLSTQRFIEEQKDSQQLIYLATEEINKITGLIDKEILRLKDENDMIDTRELEHWFRIAIRSVVAAIEAICYRLKRTSLMIHEIKDIKLNKKEIEKLKEKKINENGKEKNYYLETTENIKFSLKMIYKAFDSKFIFNDHENWEKLRKTIEIRNKITHPKNVNNYYVSSKDYRKAAEGFAWFKTQIDNLKPRNY